ncbi:MAG: hypothetical protein Kow00114_03080 [Kiloniellaceae bacterium]
MARQISQSSAGSAQGHGFWVALGLVAIAASSLFLRADPGVAPECDPRSSNLRVLLGDTLLSVPREYGPYIFGPEGKSVGIVRELCQLPDDPAIDARSVTIRVDGHPPFLAEPGPLTKPVWNVQIEIYRFSDFIDGPERTYRSALRMIEQRGWELSELPRKHGFLSADDISEGQHIYIALPGAADRSDPVPLVIECAAREINVATRHGRIHYGRSCRTANYYAINDHLRVRYKFYDGQYPLETWRSLDAAVRALVDDLALNGGG